MTQPKFALVVSTFNEKVTSNLYQGAYNYLLEQGIEEENICRYEAPGAFELPIIANSLAKTKEFAGIICLGCVIKGETAHFEYISLASTMGIMQSMLDTETPIAFGVLTSYTREQAEARSVLGERNKGVEAAAACWKTYQTLQDINLELRVPH